MKTAATYHWNFPYGELPLWRWLYYSHSFLGKIKEAYDENPALDNLMEMII